VGKDFISLGELRRYFEANFDDEKLRRLAAAIIEHPRLKALDLMPDESLKSIFKMPDIRRDLPLRPIIRRLRIIGGDEVGDVLNSSRALQLTEKDFTEISALAEDLAAKTPKTVTASALKKAFAKPEPQLAIYRDDISGAVKVRPRLIEQFAELFKKPIAGKDQILAEMQKVFSRMTRLMPAEGTKIRKLLPHKTFFVECFDDVKTGLRFVLAGNDRKILFSIEKVVPLRTLSWRLKATRETRKLLVLPNPNIKWQGIWI
jgi:hypothetical protein